jgi:Carboxypeptidase regulatory-like domain
MIEGYPETVTVSPGDTLILCVSTDHPRFRVDFYRQGVNLDFMGSNEWLDGAAFARGAPDQDWQWGRHEFTVPADWPSGVYIAMFFELDGEGNVVSAPENTTIADGRSAKALFVVRSAAPGKTAPILYKVPLFTYQAYNDTNSPISNTDGGSLYTGAAKVTLRRTGGGTGGTPWDINHPDVYDGSSPRQTFAHWDVPFISWLEKNGYSADYCTDLDIHENPGNLLANYRLLLSVGHDEYWSAHMRANVEAFIQNAGNVGLFSGNTCWWRIHLEDNNSAFGRDDNWPDGDLETKLTGVSIRHAGGWWDGSRDQVGYTVQHADHWVFGGTGLQDGWNFGAEEHLVGYECDGTQLSDQADVEGFVVPSFADGTPPSFVILGVGRLGAGWQYRTDGDKAAATMGLYTNTGTVFTAATVDWARALASGEKHVDQITRNVIGSLVQIILIYGTVTDSQGNPIPGVTVRVAESDPGIVPGIYTTTTDAGGHYSITLYPGLYTGTYSLDAFGPDIVEVNISLGRIPLGATVTQDLRLLLRSQSDILPWLSLLLTAQPDIVPWLSLLVTP